MRVYQQTLAKAGAALMLASLSLPTAMAACSRSALLGTVDQFLEGLEIGSASPLQNIASNFEYIENNKTINIVSGILGNVLIVDHNRTIIDLVACATYTEVISPRSVKPFVLGAQIRHRATDNAVFLIDTVVSTTNDWLFNATQTLQYVLGEHWGPIEPAKRDSRETIQAAADAYLDMWSNKSAIAAVPWGSPCVRLEGSVYTGKGLPDDVCTPGIPTNNTQAPNSARRYVIDETVGSVNVINVFEHLENAADSHEFRLEGGKLRYVHTITVADSKKSYPGLGPAPPPSAP